MRRLLLSIGVVFCLTTAANAATIHVQCELKNPDTEKTEWIRLKLENDKIVRWDKTHWAQVSTGAYWLAAFAEELPSDEDEGDSPFEWEKSFKVRTGYSILELGTTADAFKVGVNFEKSRGFFTYRDLGSGAGSLGPLAMTCKQSQK